MPKKDRAKVGRIYKHSCKSRQSPAPAHNDHSHCGPEPNAEPETLFPIRCLSDDLTEPVCPVSAEQQDSDGCFSDEFYGILDRAYQYTPDVDLDEFVKSREIEKLKELRTACSQLKTSSGFLMTENENIQFVLLFTGNNPAVKMSVTVKQDFEPIIMIHRKPLPKNHDMYVQNAERKLSTVSQLDTLLKRLFKSVVFTGNSEDQFAKFCDKERSMAYVETDSGGPYSQTVRAADCQLLCEGLTCRLCIKFRATLRKQVSRHRTSIATPAKDFIHSTKAHAKMTRSELITKLDQSKQHSKQLEREVAQLKRRLQNHISEEGIALSKKDHTEMSTLFEHHSCEILKTWPDENSFQRLFWEQQMQHLKLNNKKNMRWHPMIIKWCIYLQSRSSTAYDNLRESGFISLPSQRTLYDYSHFLKAKMGFQTDALKHMIEEAKLKGMYDPETPWTKYVGILQDEIKIKQDLVYDHHTGELIGYVDLDQTGNQLLDMENLKEKAKPVVSHILVLMVRGCTSDFRYPLAAFATEGVRADKLYPIIWRAVEILHVIAKLSAPILSRTS